MQIYLPVTMEKKHVLNSLSACLDDVKSWLSKNVLFLNSDKSEVIVFGPSETRTQNILNLEFLNFAISSQVQNLGVEIDNGLKFDRQISSVVGSSFFYLRSLSKIKTFLSNASLEVAIHAFITPRLDYCNSLYYGVFRRIKFPVYKLFKMQQLDSWRDVKKCIMLHPFWDLYIGCLFSIELNIKSYYLSINL